MVNRKTALGQKTVGAHVGVRRAKMGGAAKQCVALRQKRNVMKQAGRHFIEKYGKAGLVRLENVGAERGHAVAVRHREYAALSIMQRSIWQRDKFCGAAEGSDAFDGSDLADERPLAGERGQGEGNYILSVGSGCSATGLNRK